MKQLIFWGILTVLSFVCAIIDFIGADKVCLYEEDKERLRKSPNRKIYQHKAAVLSVIRGAISLVCAVCTYWQLDNYVVDCILLPLFFFCSFAKGRLWKKCLFEGLSWWI